MPGGWDLDDYDVDPETRLEAENLARLGHRLLELIEESIRTPDVFSLTPAVVCEFNRLAVEGLIDKPGVLRQRDNEISRSKHVTPQWAEVPQHVDDMCTYVNEGGRDAVETAAYVLWRLNWIHPFEDGNGRTARAVAYLLLSFSLRQVIPGDVTVMERITWEKGRYFAALESADAAWKNGHLDVSMMTAFLNDVLRAQLEDAADS